MFARLRDRIKARRVGRVEAERERVQRAAETRRHLAQEAQHRTGGDSLSGSSPFYGDPR